MDINKVVYRPSCLIADAAGAITNGFMAAFNYGSIEDFWAKNYVCHHVVGLAVFKKKAAYQDIHMQIAICQTIPRENCIIYYALFRRDQFWDLFYF